MLAMNIQQQYATLSKQIQTAQSIRERAILQAQQRKLKPQLQAYYAGTTVKEVPSASKQQPTKTQQELTQDPLPVAFNFYLYPASQRAAVFADRVYAKWLE